MSVNGRSAVGQGARVLVVLCWTVSSTAHPYDKRSVGRERILAVWLGRMHRFISLGGWS